MMEIQLRKLGPNSRIKILKVPEECRTKIWLAGRGTSCQIYTKSKYASRQHFSITFREQKYFISDLQSANGTFLNDEKITGEKMLTYGDIISVGVPSEMQNSPDCVVYVFEPCKGAVSSKKQSTPLQNDPILKKKTNSTPSRNSNIENQDVDPLPTTKVTYYVMNIDNDYEKTVLNDSSSSDIVLIEPEELLESKPAKIQKLEEVVIKNEDKGKEFEPNNMNCEEEDIFAYEALTQVDESQIKTEPDMLNYSLTEELIELSDSEDDWSPGPRSLGYKSPEEGGGEVGGRGGGGEDEDDEVVVLETIIRSKGTEPASELCMTGEELTETDKKWMGKLLNVKKEEIFKGDNEALEEMTGGDQLKNNEKTEAEVGIAPFTVRLSKLDVQDLPPSSTAETLSNVEAPRKKIKRVAKKSVSFDMVPQIQYFEAPSRPRLTASEKGRIRFTRVIYNICNWNTHWLEECRKVAPDKDPPGICEERLRKIPKKFPTHSDYMAAFLPAMLLHLWNKIKEKQTVSCDSYEDYQSENLCVYKCTGLVQSVNAHKQLLREGHLVLLRLHQIQDPQFTTPASEKYAKKLGYLVFGFVESKVYERFHKQPLHEALAERCGSVVGDLHVVKLRIVVKKRPNFKVDKKKLLQLTVVHQISQEIRMFKGMCFLPDSPLCPFILKPSSAELPQIQPPENAELVFKGPVDDVQKEIVRKLSQTISVTSSFLYSIHGAAGTGKGQVAMALMLELLYGDEWKSKRPKIIYCSQWSIPLDEMVVKLKNYRQTLDEPFSLVRVGPIREVKPDVRVFSLSNLASQMLSSDKRNSDGRKFDAEMEVIREADIICTTCISSGISKMVSVFEKLLTKDKDRKVICIIDEAMSCKETDAVIPLLLGVTHLILIGDIYQGEPKFSGEKTHSLGLDMSLFWRIYKNFTNFPKEPCPIFILQTQYRMNSSLSKFTSFLIYNTALQKPAVSVSDRMGNIRSHLLLVMPAIGRKEQENQEVQIVSQFIKAVTKLTKTMRRGVRFAVIPCDARQIESFQTLLPKREFPEVEIDHKEAFQGREFEMVAIVYDGRKISKSWMATALTRARCGLFMFASKPSINGSSFFRKIKQNAEKYGFLKYVNVDMTVKDFEEIVKGP